MADASSDGRDGSRFRPLFWYSAYPDLNTGRIRTNSRIRRGIAAATESEAGNWLSLFGSTPRPVAERKADAADVLSAGLTPVEYLDTGEIQAIFFSGFGSLEHAGMLADAVPDELSQASARRGWNSSSSRPVLATARRRRGR